MTKLHLNVCNLIPSFALRAGVKVETPWFHQWPTIFSFLSFYPVAFQNVLRNSNLIDCFVIWMFHKHTLHLKKYYFCGP